MKRLSLKRQPLTVREVKSLITRLEKYAKRKDVKDEFYLNLSVWQIIQGLRYYQVYHTERLLEVK